MIITRKPHYLSWAKPRVEFDDSLVPGGRLFGCGVQSYLAAAILAFSNGLNTGFVRTKVKPHGLMAEVEGSEPAASDFLCAIDLDGVGLDAVGLRGGRVISPRDGEPATARLLQRPARIAEPEVASVEKLIRHLTGSFILSSGIASKNYVDSLPVTLYESSARVSAELAIRLLGKADIIIAPPYGGVSLGVMLALMTGAELRVPLIGSTSDSLPAGAVVTPEEGWDRCLVVDDFYSTGSTILRALGVGADTIRTFAVCAPLHVAEAPGTRLKCMFTSLNGRAGLSDACQGVLDKSGDE